MYELVPGFAAGLLATVVVSLLSAPPTRAGALIAAGRDARTRGD
ncbi:MAG: hypothetical protein R6X22_11145 [Gemmatimonadota bacterium]